ncbi:hypothetical protein MA16_Dca006477 [Dendrobium catenatum]|uniref:Retrovirus-related Pol polyprotein from transposon TNT 1-94 n=1 Tax=Dendrobium catenatum TaxID=906689 RepID=A0A2I0X7X9_9ASPA|nr:hypothetical protein MA16_Dca006477 [Dendrobium catenatum]
MIQYLTEIKSLVDKIAGAGSVVDIEDIILYILNGLPTSYQSFKTAIRTMLTPIHLDQLYPLLLSEEVNLAKDAARTNSNPDPNMVLFTYRGCSRRSQDRNSSNNNVAPRTTATTSLICQICLKKGHSASSCWHRLNIQYIQSTRQNTTALVANSETNDSN